MNSNKGIFFKSIGLFLAFTVICGLIYTGVVTGIAKVFFPKQANGSMIEVDGVYYGSELMGQQYNDDEHMWGRIMNLDVSTYKDENGEILLYAAPSNLSPASDEYEEIVAERVHRLKEANPAMVEEAVPVDLVTCSGSGLDPEISPAAAEYQISRIASARSISEEEVKEIIESATSGKFLGIFGEERVNVLKVNLMLDGVLQ